MKKNLIVGQSGGPTAVINGSLYGVVTEAMRHTEEIDEIYGMINGIEGFLNGHMMDMRSLIETNELSLLRTTPGSYLGSCRYKLPEDLNDPVYPLLFNKFTSHGIGYFFYIGGNDSMDTVAKLSEYAKIMNSDIHFIGIPKTIDNDLMGTDHTPGYGSAAKYVASSMLEIAYDSSIYKLKSITIVEIMGRNAGWLTAASALARTAYSDAPDLIYLPEVPFDQEQFLDDIAKVFEKKRSVIIAVSEGIKNKDGDYLDQDSRYVKKDAFGHILHSGTGKVLETICFKRFKCKVRSIELNVLQRCAMHIASETDIEESFMIGSKAVHYAKDHSGVMVVIKRLSNDPYQSEAAVADVSQIANLEHKIPVNWINDAHNDITKELYDYIYPLIQGEVNVRYHNGIPSYINIRHLEK